MTHQEVIQILKDQGLNVFPCVKKAAIMKNWQNEILDLERVPVRDYDDWLDELP